MHLRRHFSLDISSIAAGFLLLVLALIAGGCAGTPRAASQSNLPPPAKSPTEVAPATTRPDSMDASTVNPADIVARRAEAYSQEMAPALARRAADPNTAVAPPPQPSLVQWGDAGDTQLSLLPGYLLRPNSPPPALAAVDASASSANPAAGQLASMRSEPSGNSARVGAAQPSNYEGTNDRSRSQIASVAPLPGASEAMQANSSEASVKPGDVTGDAAGDGTGDATGEATDQTLGALDARLSKRVRDYPHDVSAQFDYQLLQFVMDEPVPNLSTISALPDEDREMVSAVMDGLSNYRNNLRADNNMLLSRKIRPLLEMADRLRSLADLTIPTLALCQEVRGFGNYTPFDGDPPHFSAGVEHEVILYCEVQNFSSQLDDNKMWQTELGQDAVLYTEGGMSVWTDKTRSVNDSARNRRQDFFLVQRMSLPATLPMGRYLLKVTIEDKQSHHVAEATQPLLIVAQ
jgi:hypothetical protein